jgi:hypothetical protein
MEAGGTRPMYFRAEVATHRSDAAHLEGAVKVLRRQGETIAENLVTHHAPRVGITSRLSIMFPSPASPS